MSLKGGNSAIAIALFAVLLVIAFPNRAYADKEEIYFRADKQREITKENITILTGNVEIHFRDYIVWADEVRVDDDKKEFYASSAVKMEGEDRTMHGDALWYNYDTDEFLMMNVNGVMTVEGVGEPVYFTATRIKGTPKAFKMIDGTATTCTPQEPQEVHIRAKMIKVMEDNKIIFRNGYFFVYDIPIIYFPYWIFSLREVPYEIRVGKNDTDGVFVEVDWHYLFKPNILGTWILNYYSRRGWEFGGDHQWNIPGQGTGKLFFTYLRDRKSGPETVINASQDFQPWNNTKIHLQLDQSSKDYFGTTTQKPTNRLNSRMTFSRTSPHANLNLGFTLNTVKSTDLTYRYTWRPSNIAFNTRFNYDSRHQTGSAANQQLKSNYELGNQGKKVRWDILFDMTADPDGDKKLNDQSNVLEKVPEVTLTLSPEVFALSKHNPLSIEMKQVSLKGGHYFDNRPSGETKGLFGSLDTEFDRSVKLSGSADLRFSLGYNQTIASNGNAKYLYSPSINYNQKFGKKLTMQTTWSQSVDKGRMPFPTFDRSGNRNDISWNLGYRSGTKWDMRWSTGYNVKTSDWNTFNYRIQWRPDQKWDTNLTLTYNINNGDFGDLNPRATYDNKRNLRNDTSLTYSVRESKLTRFSDNIEYRIKDIWSFEVQLEPDIRQGFFTDFFRKVLITKNNPCTFYQLSYESQRNAYYFMWGITALPAANLSFGSGLQTYGAFDQFSSGGSNFGLGGY
jgi:hypothetical protein